MMTRGSFSLLPLVALAIASLSVIGLVNGARDDPSQFFGGVDNEPYMEWLNTRGSSSTFKNFVFLDSTAATSDVFFENGAAFHWSIDETNEILNFALIARATGWMGFGLSENGGMRGADMVIFEAANPDRLIDAYVLDDIFSPAIDECQSWEVLYSQTTDGFLIVEAQRPLDTHDSQDRRIYNDREPTVPPQLIIAAWGDSDTWTYHGPKNRSKGAIRFFGPGVDVWEQFHSVMEEEADGSFFVGAKAFAIPSADTTYQRFCFNEDDLRAAGVPVDEPLHVIGIEPILDPNTVEFVHHFTLMTSEIAGSTCDESNDHFETLYGWAPGGLPHRFPSNLGSPLGVDGLKFYDMEIHYNNPEFTGGNVDNSGVKIYWTRQKREFDVGTFALADPRTNLAGEPLGDGLSEHTYSCPSSCTSSVLPVDQKIYIIGTVFHMHRQGRKASIQVMREGQVVYSTAIDFFDFDQAGSIYVQPTVPDSAQLEPFELLPGDSMVSTCYFENKDDTTFGLSGSSEMCITSFQYYPRQMISANETSLICGVKVDIPECAAEHEMKTLASADDLNRLFGYSTSDGVAAPYCIEHPSETSSSIDPSDDSSGGMGSFAITGAVAIVLPALWNVAVW